VGWVEGARWVGGVGGGGKVGGWGGWREGGSHRLAQDSWPIKLFHDTHSTLHTTTTRLSSSTYPVSPTPAKPQKEGEPWKWTYKEAIAEKPYWALPQTGGRRAGGKGCRVAS